MGITAGIIPAAATTGMLLGYGIRVGGATRVLQALGAIVLGMSSAPALASSIGLLLHVAATLVIGIAYVSLTGESGEHRIAWAITLGAAMAATLFVVARTIAGSIALVLTPGNLIAIGVVIAITLPMGMRFAPSRL